MQCVDGFSFFNKGMLEKATPQRIQQFSAFACDRKNPFKCSACAFARNIETDLTLTLAKNGRQSINSLQVMMN